MQLLARLSLLDLKELPLERGSETWLPSEVCRVVPLLFPGESTMNVKQQIEH